jgi:hypothetical protein
MAGNYSKNSPYFNTEINGDYLDIINFRKIPIDKNDIEYEIGSKYLNRPDLLAHDLYGDSNLWWVFAARNPNKIKDPINDMIPGNVIFLPKVSNI